MTNPLKDWRGERSQGEAGRLLGVNAMTYSRWERGLHLPRKTQWKTIEDVTGVTPAKLAESIQVEEAAQ